MLCADGAQSTATMRSGCSDRLATLGQSLRCTDTPEPRVTKPMIRSPGTGVQQRASLISTSLMPCTTTPASPRGVRRRRSVSAGTTSASAWSSADPSSPPCRSMTRLTTFCAPTLPSPTAAYSAATSTRCRSLATVCSTSGVSSRCSGRPSLRSSRAIDSLPRSIASSRRSLVNHCRILLRARGLLTKPSQSRLGPAPGAFDVNTSTTSPLSSVLSSGTSRPLTRAPMQRWPTSVCTAYAKSTGVDPAGSDCTSPRGVNT